MTRPHTRSDRQLRLLAFACCFALSLALAALIGYDVVSSSMVANQESPLDRMTEPTRALGEKGDLFHTFGSQTNITIDKLAATNQTAADIVGVSGNAEGDFGEMLAALSTYSMMASMYLGAFCALRRAFPDLYISGDFAPEEVTLIDWIKPTLNMNLEELEERIGLDHVMLLHFSNLCIKLFTFIGIAMTLILCPLHYVYGKKHVDQLSKFDMVALEAGSPVYWVHAVLVWCIVGVASYLIHSSHEYFVQRRHQWLRSMKEPRVNTLLVQNIPENYRNMEQLRSFFEKLFSPKLIKDVSIVKTTKGLKDLVKHRDLIQRLAQHKNRHLEEGCCAALGRRILGIDAPPTMTIETLRDMIEHDKELIHKSASELCGINTANGFVTFTYPRDAFFAMHLQISSNTHEWQLSIPPKYDDVHWDHLAMDHGLIRRICSKVLGWMCMFFLFIFFGPIVTSISSAGAVANELMKHSVRIAPLRAVIGGILPSLGLLLFTGFLPTIIMLIFRAFFTMVSESELQFRLFIAYFMFNVIFVLLVPAVGSSLLLTIHDLLDRPTNLILLLAETLPKCSHFYVSYIILHWASQCLNLTRYWSLLKYLWHRRGYDQKKARKLSEPEDQDYYGIGSRSARWSVLALIGLFYCQLDPTVSLVALVNFLLTRLVYGYLIVFAEEPKPDLGGRFWVSKLWGLQLGLFIYVAFMTGVLWIRAGSMPAIVAGSSSFYLLVSMNKFWHIGWKKLPFELLPPEHNSEIRGAIQKQHGSGPYTQPELLEEPSDITCNSGAAYEKLPTSSNEVE